MRWDHLFEDLDAQAAAGRLAEREGEVAERTRDELARQTVLDRLLGHAGEPLAAHLVDGSTCQGLLVGAGAGWVLLGDPVVVVVTSAVAGWSGLGRRPVTSAADVRRRHGLPAVLRTVARDRSPVRLRLVGGAELHGTVDAVGADHLDLAEHDPGRPRRSRAVRSVRTVPFTGLVTVRPAEGTSSLG